MSVFNPHSVSASCNKLDWDCITVICVCLCMCVYIGWILVFAASWGWFCFYSSSSYNKTIKMGELSSITCWNWNFSRSHKVRTNFTKNIRSYKSMFFVRNPRYRPRYFDCSLISSFSAFKVIKWVILFYFIAILLNILEVL